MPINVVSTKHRYGALRVYLKDKTLKCAVEIDGRQLLVLLQPTTVRRGETVVLPEVATKTQVGYLKLRVDAVDALQAKLTLVLATSACRDLIIGERVLKNDCSWITGPYDWRDTATKFSREKTFRFLN